ncbi:MAG: hypothetical protein MI923_03210, partial [Phycisphaerales bacterium]|nr:hypothetical protein [Phycisphaerales bacterium]
MNSRGDLAAPAIDKSTKPNGQGPDGNSSRGLLAALQADPRRVAADGTTRNPLRNGQSMLPPACMDTAPPLAGYRCRWAAPRTSCFGHRLYRKHPVAAPSKEFYPRDPRSPFGEAGARALRQPWREEVPCSGPQFVAPFRVGLAGSLGATGQAVQAPRFSAGHDSHPSGSHIGWFSA